MSLVINYSLVDEMYRRAKFNNKLAWINMIIVVVNVIALWQHWLPKQVSISIADISIGFGLCLIATGIHSLRTPKPKLTFTEDVI